MAWRSSGNTNDELISNLKRFGVISSAVVEDGYRSVDRKNFVPRIFSDMAYTDQPLKEGNIHISAPHIYGSVLESLELQKGQSLRFLNAGSGTGYLTCIAASILGPTSSHYCIDIHQDVLDHCEQSIGRWKQDYRPAIELSKRIHLIRGNALEIDASQGEAKLGFDRIYIGAAVDEESVPSLKNLLSPGGILVGPVEEDLVKITRSVSPDAPQQFVEEVISGVRFAPLLDTPHMETIIPAQLWSPSVHQYYPDSFKQSSKALLLCSRSNFEQPVIPQPPPQRVNTASMLPKAIWMEILSFTHKDWFETEKSETDFLRQRLAEEQANAQRANERRLEAEARLATLERERDVYRMLARRWQTRYESMMVEGDHDHDEEPAIGEEDQEQDLLHAPRFGFGRVLSRFRSRHGPQAEESSSSEEEEDDESEEVEPMEEDNIEDMSETMVDGEDSTSQGSSAFIAAEPIESDVDSTAIQKTAFAYRQQSRTVSISEDDF